MNLQGSIRKITVQRFDPAAFAPFGAIIEGPTEYGERSFYSDWVAPETGLDLQFHVNSVAVSALPIRLAQMEKHPRSAQVFLPLDVERYLVTVMPEGADGSPDPSRTLCMEVPGTLGVVYAKGAWHAGVTVLGRDGKFAVLMRRGAPDDDVFVPIDAIDLVAGTVGQEGART